MSAPIASTCTEATASEAIIVIIAPSRRPNQTFINRTSKVLQVVPTVLKTIAAQIFQSNLKTKAVTLTSQRTTTSNRQLTASKTQPRSTTGTTRWMAVRASYKTSTARRALSSITSITLRKSIIQVCTCQISNMISNNSLTHNRKTGSTMKACMEVTIPKKALV